MRQNIYHIKMSENGNILKEVSNIFLIHMYIGSHIEKKVYVSHFNLLRELIIHNRPRK